MNLKFWKPKQAPAGATVDEVALMERANRIILFLYVAGIAAMERAKNDKEKRAIIKSFKQTGEIVQHMTGDQLAAFLDLAESSIPDEIKARLGELESSGFELEL